MDLNLARAPARLNALVVVVDGDRQRLFGAHLPHCVAIQFVDHFLGLGILGPLLCFLLGEYVVAQRDALVADKDPRP